MRFELKNKVTLSDMKPETAKAIRQQLTLLNPAHAKAERMGRWTGRIPRTLKFYKETPAGIECPRGEAYQLRDICRHYGEQIHVVKNFLKLSPIDFTFNGTLRPYQQDNVTGVLVWGQGTLIAPTGSGKTCMGLNIIAKRKQPALIICHTKNLQSQWIDAIEKLLGIPADKVGVIGGGKFSLGDQVTVALVQSLYRRLDVVTPHIGHLVVDECHHTPSRTFTEAVNAFPAMYRLGLTATPSRGDELDEIIFWHIGPVTGRIDKQGLLDDGYLCEGEAVFFQTGFTPVAEPSGGYSLTLSELIQNLDRNKLICRTINKYHGTGITLILSDRQKHCVSLAGILKAEHDVQASVLTGKTPAKQREQIIQDLRSGKCRFLVATGSLIGEGFDLPEISNLALATPIKSSTRLIQYVGRALRPAPGKTKAVILDFVDAHGVFQNSARSRWRTYEQQGIEVTGKF